MSDIRKKRNSSLDVLKGVAAIFVILIHEQFPGTFGKWIAMLAGFAVPVFFMVSGYFSYNAPKERLKTSIKHILVLIVIAYVLNIGRLLVTNHFSVTAVCNYFIEEILTIKHIAMWLLLNVTLVSGVAWFLFALLYCYIFCLIFHKMFLSGKICAFIMLGFAGGLVLRMVFPLLGMNSFGTNNAWCCGIPYFLCGLFIRQKQEEIVPCVSCSKCCVAAGVGCVLITIALLVNDNISYIGVVPLAVSIFALCIKYPRLECGMLERIGNEHAFYVYIGHPIVIHFINAILPRAEGGLMAWLRPLIVISMTIGSAMLFYPGLNLLRKEWQKVYDHWFQKAN